MKNMNLPKIIGSKVDRKFWAEVRYVVNTIEYAFLKEKNPPWETTKDFAKLHNRDYPEAYRLIRAAADFWNQNLSKGYGVMYDCDYHGYRWRFHKEIQELKDLCWIAAIRTAGHNKRSLNNFGYATEINEKVEKDIKLGEAKIVVPSRFKDYENNES